MDSIYAETLSSFAYDLNNLWKEKQKLGSAMVNKQDLNEPYVKYQEDCSFNRFILSASSNFPTPSKVQTEYLSNVDRLQKTTSIWIQPDITRGEVEKILQDFEKGIFIVRMGTDKKSMVLSYKTEDKVQHVLIKVDVKKGFFMDGSQNIFKSVNVMISHYMTHSIQNPDVVLKLPKVLREASTSAHFKFFDNLKSEFWNTSLPNKSIDDIWSVDEKKNSSKDNSLEEDGSTPPLPPRGYMANDINIIQGTLEIPDNVYQVIRKEDSGKSQKSAMQQELPPEPTRYSSDISIYSELWKVGATNYTDKKATEPSQNSNGDSEVFTSFTSKSTEMTLISTVKLAFEEDFIFDLVPPNAANKDSFLIKDIIRYYYPQIINLNLGLKELKISSSSLKDDIENSRKVINMPNIIPTTSSNEVKKEDNEEYYAIPWELKYPWISKLMTIDGSNAESESQCMEEIVKAESLKIYPTTYDFSGSKHGSTKSLNDKGKSSNVISERGSLVSLTDDDDDDVDQNDTKLQHMLLAAIQPVMVSSSTSTQNIPTKKSQYGKSIRDYLIKLCSRRGNGDISNSVRMFIQCTIDRADLSPYTTMRLIRQYMSGLKNMIKQQKSEYTLLQVIEEERRKTPKNIFINLESIIESVLTKAVVKPLTSHIYRLLVLEHYKNNNLKLISDGVEEAKKLEPEKLGLVNSSIEVIQSRLKMIRHRFKLMAKQYAPEKKIGHLISIIEIVFQLVRQIYPEIQSDFLRTDFKTDNVLPILVYIFSQCKLDAIAAQCEVEYIEGLIWSSTLVNGEPGFYLMNLMSALEAIKVLARPQLNANDFIDLKQNNPTKVDNSSFYSKINPSSLSAAAVGSVNVIILDEKLNRLITKTFPVRSTVSAGVLCNSIAHRLGIFNPKEYNLYKFTGTEDILLDENALPLQIKQDYQQKTGETINFLFKRNNAIFILPTLIEMKASM